MTQLVRLAEPEQLPSILELYSGARDFMASRGNPDQWGRTHPPVQQLEEDISRGVLYTIWRDGIMVGVFAFLLGEDPTYRRIEGGRWGSTTPYGTIHRLASDGSGGIFHACACYCSRRISHLRVDTHERNLPMQRAILREGFTRRGIIYLPDGSPRIAYDRLL